MKISNYPGRLWKLKDYTTEFGDLGVRSRIPPMTSSFGMSGAAQVMRSGSMVSEK